MAFYDSTPFPERISAGMQAVIRYMADAAFSQAGQRYFNLYDTDPVREWAFSHPPRSGAEFEEFRAFFMAVRGLDPFLFKDWSDYRASQANTSLTLISGSAYQMNRIYVAPGRTTVKPIYKPKSGALIYRTRSGSTSDITGDSTVSTTTGQVTVTGHMSGDTYTWSGNFYFPAYFSVPEATFNVIGGSSMLTDWPDITIRESREIA